VKLGILKRIPDLLYGQREVLVESLFFGKNEKNSILVDEKKLKKGTGMFERTKTPRRL